MTPRYAPIEDYGIIGDLHTVALVGKDGSIDFLCLPSFDSPSVFAALLDADRGGRFRIAPELDDAVHRQLYLPDTNVLLTRFLSDSGVAEVSDFMPVADAGTPHHIVRRAKAVQGDVTFYMRCAPRFDYGRARHAIEMIEGELPDSHRLPPTRVPAERYPAMSWVTEEWGMAPVIFAGQGKKVGEVGMESHQPLGGEMIVPDEDDVLLGVNRRLVCTPIGTLTP